jgi:hypothetical protein
MDSRSPHDRGVTRNPNGSVIHINCAIRAEDGELVYLYRTPSFSALRSLLDQRFLHCNYTLDNDITDAQWDSWVELDLVPSLVIPK